MTITVYAMDDSNVVEVFENLPPRKAHRMMRWLKRQGGLYFTVDTR